MTPGRRDFVIDASVAADLALIREIRGFDREENVVPLADVARALRASPPG